MQDNPKLIMGGQNRTVPPSATCENETPNEQNSPENQCAMILRKNKQKINKPKDRQKILTTPATRKSQTSRTPEENNTYTQTNFNETQMTKSSKMRSLQTYSQPPCVKDLQDTLNITQEIKDLQVKTQGQESTMTKPDCHISLNNITKPEPEQSERPELPPALNDWINSAIHRLEDLETRLEDNEILDLDFSLLLE
jgi:hypothetical protein